MGYEYADAQNISVRVLLNQFSKNFEYFDKNCYEKTLKYFDNKCPYTGEEITTSNCEKDHIVPMNRECCGLHVYGNVLIVAKSANKRKGAKNLEEFLENEPERLAKIQKFINNSGYKEIHEKYNNQLKLHSEELYKNVGALVKNSCEYFDKLCIVDKVKVPVSDDDFEKEVEIFARKMAEQESIKKISAAKDCPREAFNYNTPSLSKGDIVSICRKNGINIIGNHTKSAKNHTQDKYWANPNIDYLRYEWFLTLDDYNNRILYCFKIPANSISENQIKVRHDKQNLIDLQIYYNDNNFIDSRSGISFAQWLVKSIEY